MSCRCACIELALLLSFEVFELLHGLRPISSAWPSVRPNNVREVDLIYFQFDQAVYQYSSWG